MKLSQIVTNSDYLIQGDGSVEIKGIDYDSRKIKPGYVFVALPGHHVDGKKFIADAIEAGAKAIVLDKYEKDFNITQVIVPNPLSALADLSANFYGHPDKKLQLIGITGTNGKTTTTYFLESIFENVKMTTGVIGTINYRYADKVFPATNTTPQSADIYRIFHEMVEKQRQVAIMEVSSHALSLERVSGMEFDISIFTNLTRDHLDFHHTMEEYFEAKSKLFTNLKSMKKKYQKFAIINADDLWGKKLIEIVSMATVVTYGIKEKADVTAQNIHISSKGTEFVLITPVGHKKVIIPHLGKHNVYNALASAAAGISSGISLDAVVNGMENAPMAPGRLEKVDEGQNFAVVVDYAHTDDALVNVINALRDLKPGRIITVFGCGGDRDRSKRPIMGEVATALSDYVIVTSDNQRSEDPQKIILDIEVGIRRQHRNNYQQIVDREQAIAAAINMAQKGDIVLLAGKGHENYQIIGDQKIHFNDKEIAAKYINKRKDETR